MYNDEVYGSIWILSRSSSKTARLWGSPNIFATCNIEDMIPANGDKVAVEAAVPEEKDQTINEADNAIPIEASEEVVAAEVTEQEDGQGWNSIPSTHLGNPFNRDLMDKNAFSQLLVKAEQLKSVQRIDHIIDSIKKLYTNAKTEEKKAAVESNADVSTTKDSGANESLGDASLLRDHLHQAFALKSQLFGTKASFWIEWY